MSNANDAFSTDNPKLLTLKGEVSVHFLDGQVIEGKFASQDAFNIFLMVEGEPTMIPRHQIRYIKGNQGQQIEADTSQQNFFTTDPQITDEYAVDSLDDDEENTVVVPFGIDEMFAEEEEEEEDGTVVLGPISDMFGDHEDDEEDDGTVILSADLSEFVDEDNEEEDDGTVILAAPNELEPELDAADATVAPESEIYIGVSASLLCIGGPHTGQTFHLTSDTNTIGRSSDNHVVLSGDKEISRHHAIISRRDDHFVVQDNDSLNGTFVNDERVTIPRTLEINDIIVVGISALKYEA